MVLHNSLRDFFWVGRELKGYGSGVITCFFKNLFLSEVICGGESKALVCNSYLFGV